MAHTPSGQPRKPSVRDMPEPIPDSPENVAAALMGSKPRKADEWRYAQQIEEVPVDPAELDNWRV